MHKTFYSWTADIIIEKAIIGQWQQRLVVRPYTNNNITKPKINSKETIKSIDKKPLNFNERQKKKSKN